MAYKSKSKKSITKRNKARFKKKVKRITTRNKKRLKKSMAKNRLF